jgi:hypothetical protein
MADSIKALTASGLVYTGKGFLAGLVISFAGAWDATGTLIVYDNTSAAGTIIFQCEANLYNTQNEIFFPDRYAPRFTTGCYVALDANVTVTVWVRGV